VAAAYGIARCCARQAGGLSPRRASIDVRFHVYGRDGVMQELERRRSVPHELGIVIDVVGDSQDLAYGACHQVSGALLHYHHPGQLNTSGNLAFPYSPSEFKAGPVFEFTAYHLMKVEAATDLFPITFEDL
jgi:hypothetical protein